MDLDIELFLIFFTAIIFTVLLMLFGREKNTKITFGTLSFISWCVFALVFIASAPTYPPLGLLFFGIGSIIMFATIYDTLELMKKEKSELTLHPS